MPSDDLAHLNKKPRLGERLRARDTADLDCALAAGRWPRLLGGLLVRGGLLTAAGAAARTGWPKTERHAATELAAGPMRAGRERTRRPASLRTEIRSKALRPKVGVSQLRSTDAVRSGSSHSPTPNRWLADGGWTADVGRSNRLIEHRTFCGFMIVVRTSCSRSTPSVGWRPHASEENAPASAPEFRSRASDAACQPSGERRSLRHVNPPHEPGSPRGSPGRRLPRI